MQQHPRRNSLQVPGSRRNASIGTTYRTGGLSRRMSAVSAVSGVTLKHDTRGKVQGLTFETGEGRRITATRQQNEEDDDAEVEGKGHYY